MTMDTAMYFEMIISITIGLTFIALILLFVYITYVKEETSETSTARSILKRGKSLIPHQKISKILFIAAQNLPSFL